MKPTVELVLGAGGVKGYFHIGLLKAIEELGIEVSSVTGVSVGAIVASFYTNGMSSDLILKLFLEAHERSGNPLLLANAVVMPDLPSFLVGWSFLSLEKPWQESVAALGIKPNKRLKIVACDARTRKAIVFAGTDYNLGTALSASGALPGVFLPVQHRDALLIDGAAYHRNPDEFSRAPAIISALGFAKTWPTEPIDAVSAYFHLREMYAPVVVQPTVVDAVRNVLIEHQADDVCGLSFSLSKKRCLEMFERGYEVSVRALREELANGRLRSIACGIDKNGVA